MTYGLLLTAWGTFRASFVWLLVVSAVCAVGFVVLGAFAETGFKRARDRSPKVRQRLLVRTVVGFCVSVFAAVAIPRSDWYDFEWFAQNELAWAITASVITGFVVLILEGLQKRGSFT